MFHLTGRYAVGITELYLKDRSREDCFEKLRGVSSCSVRSAEMAKGKFPLLICCGFDYCNYLEEDGVPQNLSGAEYLCDAPNVLKVLRARGCTEEELENIACKNALRVLGRVLR